MNNQKNHNYLYYGKLLDRQSAIKFIQHNFKDMQERNSRYAYILKVTRGKNILDYGCGWGMFSKLLSSSRKVYVTGIDIDTESIRAAKELVKETHLLKFKKVSTRTIQKESFDSIISTCVIQNTLNPGSHLAECNRVLKRNGQLIITIYNEISPLYLFSQLLISKSKIKSLFSKKRDITKDRLLSWSFYNFCRLSDALGFTYVSHHYQDGIQTPYGYIHFSPLKPFYNSITFIFQKRQYINPKPNS